MLNDILPAGPMLAAFLAASLVLAVTPGPGVFYIFTRSLAQGRTAGLASVAGVALGNLGNALGASLGLAALFAVSSTAFMVARYAGGAYLVWLGIKTLRDAGRAPFRSGYVKCTAPWRVFRDGFVIALLNPKTALFFAAFLPQFMSSGGARPMAQSAALGALFVATAAITDTVYALTAGAVAPALDRARGGRAIGNRLAGGIYIGLGCLTAFAGHRNR